MSGENKNENHFISLLHQSRKSTLVRRYLLVGFSGGTFDNIHNFIWFLMIYLNYPPLTLLRRYLAMCIIWYETYSLRYNLNVYVLQSLKLKFISSHIGSRFVIINPNCLLLTLKIRIFIPYLIQVNISLHKIYNLTQTSHCTQHPLSSRLVRRCNSNSRAEKKQLLDF